MSSPLVLGGGNDDEERVKCCCSEEIEFEVIFLEPSASSDARERGSMTWAHGLTA